MFYQKLGLVLPESLVCFSWEFRMFSPGVACVFPWSPLYFSSLFLLEKGAFAGFIIRGQ